MPLIFKKNPGATLGYEWTEPDQGVEVEDAQFAYELLHSDADFYEKIPDEDEPEVELPPKTGPGSGVKAWRSYAEAAGVEVSEDASRDDVIEVLEAAGVLTQAEGSEIEESGEGED